MNIKNIAAKTLVVASTLALTVGTAFAAEGGSGSSGGTTTYDPSKYVDAAFSALNESASHMFDKGWPYIVVIVTAFAAIRLFKKVATKG